MSRARIGWFAVVGFCAVAWSPWIVGDVAPASSPTSPASTSAPDSVPVTTMIIGTPPPIGSRPPLSSTALGESSVSASSTTAVTTIATTAGGLAESLDSNGDPTPPTGDPVPGLPNTVDDQSGGGPAIAGPALVPAADATPTSVAPSIVAPSTEPSPSTPTTTLASDDAGAGGGSGIAVAGAVVPPTFEAPAEDTTDADIASQVAQEQDDLEQHQRELLEADQFDLSG